MLNEASRFWTDVRLGNSPRWLSYVGGTGTGKTHLARKLATFARKLSRLHSQGDCSLGPRNGLYRVKFVSWPEIAAGFLRGEFGVVEDLKSEWFVVIDDIGATRERMADLDVDKLFQILNERAHRWTVLTSNQTLSEIAAQEARIADRLIRSGNVVVDCDTRSYSIRQRNHDTNN